MEKNEIGAGAGLHNFRELGGYQTTDGRTVRSDLLFRGQHLHGLKKRGKRFVDGLGLSTIFDLRSDSEAGEEPDYVPFGVRYIQVPGIPSMDENLDQYKEGGNLDMKSLLFQARGDAGTIAMLRSYLKDSYHEMAIRPDAFIQVLRRLIDEPGRPLLFHCTAGKDRTGVCAAYILRVLGVPQQTVMADYLLSNPFRRREVNRTMWKIDLFLRDKELADVVRQLLTVRPELLDETFDTIDEQYGGFDVFVKEGLKLTRGDVEVLRKNYLE